MNKVFLAPGTFCVEIPEVGLSVLCGCPENSVKFLTRAGCIRSVTENGVTFDTGPNAILLSEVSIQNGAFCNLGEFPVLHMLYLQGLMVPGHPNNTGRRPLLIGLKDQVEAQSQYIFVGNYGLSDVAELEAAGLDAPTARRYHQMKLAFSFGHIRPTDELLDLRIFDNDALVLAPGVFLQRKAQNVYEFLYGNQALEVDLNLAAGESYGAPYQLPRQALEVGDFSVVHLGDGDGWDVQRPCTCSLLACGGHFSLVDAGPNLSQSLEALGLPVSRVRRLFQTHAHDDHFVGLTALMRSERRIQYHAVPWVRASVEKKFQALTGLDSTEFARLFQVEDLVPDQWNDLDGLEVMPLFSPHPIETTVFHFRVKDQKGQYHTYAHLADIAAFSVLDGMVTQDPMKPGLSPEVIAQVKHTYLQPVDIKKIDIGGGMIHGNALDFAGDHSGRIFLSHTGRVLTEAEMQVGKRPEFGEVTTLIRGIPQPVSPGWVASEEDKPRRELLRQALFPEASVSDGLLERLARACHDDTLSEGAYESWSMRGHLCVVAEGTVQLTYGTWFREILGVGGLLGKEAVLFGAVPPIRTLTLAPVRLLALPVEAVENCPLLLWNLRELYEKRLKAEETAFRFDWRREYAVGVEKIDGQHQHLFELIAGIGDAVTSGASLEDLLEKLRILTLYADFHFRTEQGLMTQHGYPVYEFHRHEHDLLAAGIREFVKELREKGLPPRNELMEFLKVWLLRHTLLEDRQYRDFFREKGVS